jgi:hypothetical protein
MPIICPASNAYWPAGHWLDLLPKGSNCFIADPIMGGGYPISRDIASIAISAKSASPNLMRTSIRCQLASMR